MKKMVAFLLTVAMVMSLCTVAFATGDDASEVIRTSAPIAVTYRDNAGNTWGFLLYCTGAGKIATVDTYFQLEKVHDSSPDTWDSVAKTSKTVANSSTVYTFEGGIDSNYCRGSQTFYTQKGELLSSYTYLSMVTTIIATHQFSYTFDGVYSSYNRQTTYSYGE